MDGTIAKLSTGLATPSDNRPQPRYLGHYPPTIVFQVKSNGFRSTEPGDEGARLQVHDCRNQFVSLLDHHSPDELTLSVTDASTPDFMSDLDGE